MRRGVAQVFRLRWVRRILWGATITVAVAAVAMAGLWWRLTSGPIELDMATPWLKAAIEKNFGGKQTVVVGGTQIERDENGRTSLRLRDIVVRDTDGTVYALNDTCTHAIASLSEGYIENGTVECPVHASQFCLKNGKVLGLPATIDTVAHKVEVRDGEIYLFPNESPEA